MDQTYAGEAVKELTLLLMYLTRFTKKDKFFESINNAWKGYDFKTLNILNNEGYINQGSHRSKSVQISEKGIEYIQELLEKYHISDTETLY